MIFVLLLRARWVASCSALCAINGCMLLLDQSCWKKMAVSVVTVLCV